MKPGKSRPGFLPNGRDWDRREIRKDTQVGRGGYVDMDLKTNPWPPGNWHDTCLQNSTLDTETVLSTCDDNLYVWTFVCCTTHPDYFLARNSYTSYGYESIQDTQNSDKREHYNKESCVQCWDVNNGNRVAWPTPIFLCACECGHTCSFLCMQISVFMHVRAGRNNREVVV